jgi:hypothetical protein
LPTWRGEAGVRFRIVISPGAVAVEGHDLAKLERSAERQIAHAAHAVDQRATWLDENGEGSAPSGKRRAITGWSAKSRGRMTRRLCELDYSPMLGLGVPAMIVLTYPGDWLPVARRGQDVKRHMAVFRRRWERAWGRAELLALWKLEFQRRGAPHVHLFTVPPAGLTADGLTFKEWLSQTWAAIVAHPDPEQYRRHVLAGTGVDYAEGLRAKDPKRLAVYFTKHGIYAAKEYQNHPPDEWLEPGCGPGRYWGYWGLERRIEPVEVSGRDALTAARAMRRWAHANRQLRVATVRRYRGGRPEPVGTRTVIGLSGALLIDAHPPKRRKVRRRAERMRGGRGWISVNDGPGFAGDLARYIDRSRP